MWLSLALGGAVGTLARYELGRWVHGWAGTAFPWGTLAINVAGCLALGFLTRLGQTATISPETRGMLTVGFCGAFTTFSTFSFETVALLQDGESLKAVTYALGSLLLGIAAMTAGMGMAGLVLRPGG
jgi:fluoride exporter